MTRRVAMIALTGMLVGVVGTGVGSVSAQTTPTDQATKSGVKQKAAKGVQKAEVEWQSLTPAQQQAYMAHAKVTAEEARAKWQAMTPEEQHAFRQKAVAAGQKAQKKWQALPPGTPATPATPTK